ncbi:hypothetical protein QQP08_007507, partial [Theobroma cacao]
MVCFCFLVDQTRKVSRSKPAAGFCSRCGGGASVADMKTSTSKHKVLVDRADHRSALPYRELSRNGQELWRSSGTRN